MASWRATLFGVCLAALPVLAQDVPSQRPVLELADGVSLLPGSFERGRQPDGNSLLLRGLDGLVIIDTGRHAEHAQALVDWVRRQPVPLKAIVNTHWHLDHLGGNARLRREWPGLPSVASQALRDAVQDDMPRSEAGLRQMLRDPAVDAITRRMVDIDLALYAERSQFLPTTVPGPTAQDLDLGGRSLRVGVERGPTRGDLWVLDRASGVLAVGDFITLPVPFLDTACPADWLAAMARLEALPFDRVVPGHGPVLDRSGFVRYHQALRDLFDCAAGTSAVAACAQRWIDDLGPMLPSGAQRSVTPMLTHYFEDRLRAPPEARALHCRP